MNKDFLFIGPQRTGTTWLYENLKKHPDICFPKGVKETMFFDRNYEKGIDWYKWHFSECESGQRRGEVAPTYFDHPDVPARVKEEYPDCKIIISLRDPVDKAQSLYQHHYQKGRVEGSFSQAIETRPEIMTSGFYADHLPRWFDLFGKSRVLVISLKDIEHRPQELMDDLCQFIGTAESYPDNKLEKGRIGTAAAPRSSGLAKIGSFAVTKLHSLRLHWVVNAAKQIGLKNLFFQNKSEKPELTEKERAYLEDVYEPHIRYVDKKFNNVKL